MKSIRVCENGCNDNKKLNRFQKCSYCNSKSSHTVKEVED